MINVICEMCNVWWSVLGVKSLLSAMTNLWYQKYTKIDLWRIRQRYISYSYRQQKRWTKMQRHVFARCYCTTQLASPGSATPLDYNALNVWCLQTLSLSETAQVLSVIKKIIIVQSNSIPQLLNPLRACLSLDKSVGIEHARLLGLNWHCSTDDSAKIGRAHSTHNS